jgi:hypothetical protein
VDVPAQGQIRGIAMDQIVPRLIFGREHEPGDGVLKADRDFT